MSDQLKRLLSRREFLGAGALAVAGAAAAACQPQTVVVEKTVKETVVVEKEKLVEVAVEGEEKVVSYITQLWNWQKLNMATATDQYNMDHRGAVRLEVDPSPDGWETKVVQMIKDNELLWDGMLRARNVGDVLAFKKMGILQPWDEFINGSSVPWATQYWDEILPNVRDAFTFDGQLYGFPWDGEVFCRVYRKDYWDELGEEPAETLADFELQLQELTKIYPDKTPMGFKHRPQMPDHHMLMQLWTDDPWIHEDFGSIPDFHSDAYKEMMLMLKRWYDSGLIIDDTWNDATLIEVWNKGNLCCLQTGAAWAQAQAKKIWGANAIVPTTNFVLEKGDQPKTLTFNNAAVLFKGAKYPQEVADWLLWMVDPTVEKIANHSFHKGYLYYFHVPAYKSVYEKIIPMNDDWKWMGDDMYKMIAASAPVPSDARQREFGPIAIPWEEKYVHGEVSLDECINGIYEEVMTLVQEKDSGTK